MPATSSNAGFILPTNAGDSGLWGNENNATIASLDTRLAGTTTCLSSVLGLNYTISSAQAQCKRIILGGVPAGPATFTFSSANYAMGDYDIWNTSTGFGLTVNTPGVGATCTIPAGSQRIVTCDGTNAYFADQVPIPVFTFPPLLQNYVTGLTMSNDAGTPATVMDFASGMCADATNSVYMLSPTAFTKNANALWAAGSGQGGMAPGLGLNPGTCYHCFIISNNVTANSSTIDFYFDTSVTAANQPANTNYYRRVGSMTTSSGAATWRLFSQVGDEFLLLTPITDGHTIAVGNTRQLLPLSVPTGLKVHALVYAFGTPNENLGTYSAVLALLSPDVPDQSAAFSSGTGSVLSVVWLPSVGAVTFAAGAFNVRTNLSGQVALRATGTVTTTVNTYGWIDRRGKDGAP